MRKITESAIHFTTLFFCLFYFIYSIGITGYDYMNLKHETWEKAENRSTVYSSRRSTTVTYNFIKNNIRISRKYPGILEGVNTWMWGINKKLNEQDISFYIRKNDLEKIKNHEIRNKKDIFGNKLNEMKSIPFFGLRKMNLEPNKLLLILDVWKYNYSILFAFILFILPYIFIFIIKKICKISLLQNQDKQIDRKIGGYMILFFILLIINLIV